MLCARTRILFNLTFTLLLVVVALCVASRHALSSSARTPHVRSHGPTTPMDIREWHESDCWDFKVLDTATERARTTTTREGGDVTGI